MMKHEYREKMLKEYLIDYMPTGWKVIQGALTAPIGYVWICNGKSHFGGERKQALIREEFIKG